MGVDDDDDIQLTLIIDIIPPINNKISNDELNTKLSLLSTSDLIDTYTINESCIYFTDHNINKYEHMINKHNNQLNKINNNEDDEDDVEEEDIDDDEITSIRFQILEQSKEIRNRIESTLFTNDIKDKIR